MTKNNMPQVILANDFNHTLFLILNLFVLVMFAAKIFNVNDLSWWIIFSPYIALVIITFFAFLFKPRKKVNYEEMFNKQ